MSAFDQLVSKLAGRPGVTDPKALAYAIGKRKFGQATMAKAASRGVPAASVAKRKRPYG